MREILFRGKRKYTGEWVEGGIMFVNGYAFIMPAGTGSVEVIPETVGQFTGLVDRNGKRIFEGDYIHAKRINDGTLTGGVVNFHNGCFAVRYFMNNPAIDILTEYEIIGNIHDNPELLKWGE